MSLDDLLRHKNERWGGPRGARLYIVPGRKGDDLRIDLSDDAPVGDFVSVAYSPSQRVIVIGVEVPRDSSLAVPRIRRNRYPVFQISMSGSTPIKFRCAKGWQGHDAELRDLGDGRLAISVPEEFEYLGRVA